MRLEPDKITKHLRIAEGSWKYVEGDHSKVVIENQVYIFVPSNLGGDEM